MISKYINTVKTYGFQQFPGMVKITVQKFFLVAIGGDHRAKSTGFELFEQFYLRIWCPAVTPSDATGVHLK